MYSLTDLNNEISQVVNAQEATGVSRIQPEWVTNEIMQRHDDIVGADSDFYLISARQTVRAATRKFLNQYQTRPEDQADPQYVLPGFERLQPRYLIKEAGEFVAIRVQDMSSAQRRAKAHELRRMGAGCYQHADELERYDDEVMAAA